MDRPPASDPSSERRTLVLKTLARYRSRLARKLQALRGDLAEAERSAEYRRFGETLLTYIKQVPARASRIVLPDPSDHARNLEITLDPTLKPQENAARFFRRAAKAERGLAEVPARLAAVEADLRALDHLLARVDQMEEHAPLPDGDSRARVLEDSALERDLEEALRLLPPVYRQSLPPPPARTRSGAPGPLQKKKPIVPSRLHPRRLRTQEGWDVLVGRSNEGNDYVTHQLARPEDYWFHVHGAAGSHVVLRRGKGKNEPSKRTIEEVAAWTAFYSQARTAGKVPVIFTRKKYVRKPRKAPPGLAICEREKTVMVKPQEPKRDALADAAGTEME